MKMGQMFFKCTTGNQTDGNLYPQGGQLNSTKFFFFYMDLNCSEWERRDFFIIAQLSISQCLAECAVDASMILSLDSNVFWEFVLSRATAEQMVTEQVQL